MERREFIALGGAAVAWPLAAWADFFTWRRPFATRVSEGHYDTCLHWQTSSFGAVYPCWWRLEEKTPKADISGIDIVTEVCAIFPSESTGSQ